MSSDRQTEPNQISDKTTINRKRLIVVFIGVVVVAVCLYLIAKQPPRDDSFLPKCVFYKMTHLHCPGCGGTRMTYELLNGHIYKAFRYNPLLFIAMPLLLVGTFSELKRYVTGRPLFKYILPVWAIMVIFCIVTSYWIVRNIPMYPFSLLAPGGG